MVRAGALGTLAVLLLVSACDRPAGPFRDPNYREPYVDGYLYRLEYFDRSVDYQRHVTVYDNDGFRMIPRVRLNSNELKPYYFSRGQYRYSDETWFRVFRPYQLSVEHYWGEAFSRVVMPGNFELTRPVERYVLELDSALVISWRPSVGARWYWVELYCDYDFLDTSGVWDDYTIDLDTIVYDTSLVLIPSALFPRHVGQLVEGDGSVAIVAGYGPELEPGDVGNIRGAGYGFFTAGNEPRDRYFYIGSPPLVRRVRERSGIETRSEAFRAVARRLSPTR